MVNIYVCDDQKEYVDNINALVEKYSPAELKYTLRNFYSGEEFLAEIKKSYASVDIVFMDIEMKEIDGIETVKVLREMFPNSIVFFSTSHSSYIADVFRLNAFQFLQKPVDEETFEIDFERALKKHESSHKSIIVKSYDEETVIECADILYIEVNNRVISIHTKKDIVTHSGKLSKYVEELENYGFINCHKSYLINLRHIKKINSSSVILMHSSEEIPLSRGYRDIVLRAFKKYNLESTI